MKALLRSWIVRGLALMMVASVAASVATAQDRAPFSQQELDQMLAPIALYPDPLLSQILMASTYPLEVVEAARWSHANPGLQGQDAVRAVEPMNWDPSVKSLTAFPQVLSMMDSKLDWTESLGEAFVGQQDDVMNTVQGLRRRAAAAGNLLSSEQMRVAQEGDYIDIEPPGPGIVYVPYYDPTLVYGPWWWPAYPPVFWAPPAYYVGPAYRPGFYWGSGIAISATFFFGHADWRHRRVTVVNNTVNNATIVNRAPAANASVRSRAVAWQPDPAHRRGAPFHHVAARQRFDRIASAAPTTARSTTPSAAVQQRSVQPRSNAMPERRDSFQSRTAPQEHRPVVIQGGQVAQPSTRQNSRAAQPEIRTRPTPQRVERRASPQPQTRIDPPRPAVQAPQRREVPRPQAQMHPHPQAPAAAAPAAPRPETRNGGGHPPVRPNGNPHRNDN